jgi:hypothetical protein
VDAGRIFRGLNFFFGIFFFLHFQIKKRCVSDFKNTFFRRLFSHTKYPERGLKDRRSDWALFISNVGSLGSVEVEDGREAPADLTEEINCCVQIKEIKFAIFYH